MQVEGWILDVRPAREGLSLLISDGRRRTPVCLQVPYDLYVKAGNPALGEQLLDHPDVLGCVEEVWWGPPWYTEGTPIQHLTFSRLSALEEVRALVTENALGEIVNTFPDPLAQAFWRLGYPATAKVTVPVRGGEVPCLDPSEVTLRGDPLAVGYEAPTYSWAEVRFFDWFGETTGGSPGSVPREFELSCSFAGEPPRVERGPVARLRDVAAPISCVDVASYPRAFRGFLSRAGVQVAEIPLTLPRHFPGSPSVREELVKYVEWSRVSFLPLRVVADASIGKALTANEARVAFHRRYLIAETQARVEGRKSLSELVAHDRGGILFRPVPGVYWNVAQLDFASMYPALISQWNISPETVNSPSPASVPVPLTMHRVEPASSRRGVVPEALQWLIARREATRARASTDPDADLRQAAVKWLLVASFGYLGFRNARFGKIEAYECVTALSRHTMDRSIRLATRRGFRVLHVMVDSLFVVREGCDEEGYRELMEELRRETGLGIKMEALYDWVTLCHNRGTSLGSPARYFGRLRGGGLKVKGLDVVRRDTPGVVRDVQARALEVLGDTETPGEFRQGLARASGLFDEARSRLARGEFSPGDLVFTVAEGRRAGGLHARWNGTPYVQLIHGSVPYRAELGFSGADTGHYTRLLERAREQVTLRTSIKRNAL